MGLLKGRRGIFRVFDDKQFNRSLFRLALPIALQGLMLASVAAADAFMLGGMDQNAMSAVSMATQIQFIQNMILSSIVSTVSILGAQYWGKGDKKAISVIFCTGIRLAGLTSLLFFSGCYFFPRPLMTLFTDEEVLISIGVEYLRTAAWSYLITGISQVYLAVFKISEHTPDAARISITTVLLNIALNAVLIFGLLGAPALGVRGAALATLIARVVELIWCVLLSFKPRYLRLSIPGLFRRHPVLFHDFLRCMLPLLGACLLWSIGFTSYTAFMGHMGTDAAAANSIASVIRDLVCCMCDGLSAGGGILVGNKLGHGDLEESRRYGIRLAYISFLCGFVSTLLMLAATPLISSLVKLTDGARALLTSMMVIMAFYMIGRAVNTVIINGIFSAGGDTLFDMYSLVVTMWCLAVPLAALGTFVLDWPPQVVYACTCLDEVGKIPWVLLHFRKYKWVKDLTRNEAAE